MNVADLGSTLAVMLILSVATERWVAIVRTAFPSLAGEGRGETPEVDRAADHGRRLAVHGLAFAGAWVASACLAGSGTPSLAVFGTVHAGTLTIPVPLAALLASGGSAFWTHVVQWTGAMKDIAQTRRRSERLAFRAQAEAMGVAPADGAGAADRRSRLRLQLDADAPDRLDAPVRRAG
jgi:hypothetical protein